MRSWNLTHAVTGELRDGFAILLGAKKVKAYLVSILLVGLALGGMGLGTFAWFNDTETYAGNVITTGDLEIQGFLYNAAGNAVEKFQLSGLVPSESYTEVGYIVVRNPSAVEEKFRLWLSNGQDPKHLDDQLDLKVTMKPGWTPGWHAPWTEYGPAGYEVYSGKLSGIVGSANALTAESSADDFSQYEFAVYKLEARLNSAAGNAYEGATYAADLNLQASQYEAPAGTW